MGEYDKLRGLVGQSMGGLKTRSIGLGAIDTLGLVISSYTAVVPCSVTLWAWGGGGGGGAAGGQGGGGGGAAGRVTFTMTPGQTFSWTYGATAAGASAAGVDAVITLANGSKLVAGGGQVSVSSAGAPGGVCSGAWDIARRGGNGGAISVAGSPGEFGGLGGAGAAGQGGGGGAAGFSDAPFPSLLGGAGGTPVAAGATPGGGGGNTSSGERGRVVLSVTAI